MELREISDKFQKGIEDKLKKIQEKYQSRYQIRN
jgi:ribosome-associated translation inhibitor RaiA